MYENLGMLAFTVLMVGQFAAVIAVHGRRATNHLMNGEGCSPATAQFEEREDQACHYDCDTSIMWSVNDHRYR